MSLTSNIPLADVPGNVLIPASASGLPRDSVVNISQILIVGRDELAEGLCSRTPALSRQVNEGLWFALNF